MSTDMKSIGRSREQIPESIAAVGGEASKEKTPTGDVSLVQKESAATVQVASETLLLPGKSSPSKTAESESKSGTTRPKISKLSSQESSEKEDSGYSGPSVESKSGGQIFAPSQGRPDKTKSKKSRSFFSIFERKKGRASSSTEVPSDDSENLELSRCTGVSSTFSQDQIETFMPPEVAPVTRTKDAMVASGSSGPPGNPYPDYVGPGMELQPSQSPSPPLPPTPTPSPPILSPARPEPPPESPRTETRQSQRSVCCNPFELCSDHPIYTCLVCCAMFSTVTTILLFALCYERLGEKLFYIAAAITVISMCVFALCLVIITCCGVNRNFSGY